MPARLVDVAQPDVPRVPAIDRPCRRLGGRPGPCSAGALDVHSGRARCSQDLVDSPSIVLTTEFPLASGNHSRDRPQHGRRATFVFVEKYEVDTTIRPGVRFVIGRHRLGSTRHRVQAMHRITAQAEPLQASRIAKSLSLFIKPPWTHKHRIVGPLSGARLWVTDVPVRRLTRCTSAKRGGHLFHSRVGIASLALSALGLALLVAPATARRRPPPGPTCW